MVRKQISVVVRIDSDGQDDVFTSFALLAGSPRRRGTMSWRSLRLAVSWLVRDPRVAVAFAVPLTVVLLAAVAAHPLVFVPLLVLGAVAFVVMDFYRAASERPSCGRGRRRKPGPSLFRRTLVTF
jgi:hypothetical protein